MQAASETFKNYKGLPSAHIAGTYRQRISNQETIWIGGAHVNQTAKNTLST